jgi:hypothetical protein
MPGTVITGSPNITLLDSAIDANLCLGNLYVSLSPSVFINDASDSPPFFGANNVLGAKIKVLNPYGVEIKSYGSSYDIVPPMTGIYQLAIPTQAGTMQYGVYTVSVQLADSDSTTYEVTKTVHICTYDKNQNPCDDRLRLVASCKNGKLTILLSEPPLFKGVYSQSRTQTIVVNFPTESGATPITSTFGNFSVQLFEGVYKVVVNVCATYNLGDNVLIRLPYSVTMEKNVKCLLDYTCIWPRIKQLWDKINSDCSQADKDISTAIAIEASLLIPTIQLANDAGEDASDYISQLEKLLGCVCTCDCNGSPIVNGTPSTDLAIEGCGFEKTTVGLTDIYTFTFKEYSLVLGSGILTLSAPAIDGCTQSQTIGFNISAAYAAIKSLIGNTTEYNFWAGVINNTLNDIDASCLGYSPTQWAALTFAQKFQALLTKACAGGNCDAAVTATSHTRSGADVILNWTSTGAAYNSIWVDGDFVDSKLASITTITLPGYANGQPHIYEIRPFCTNNVQGVSAGGTFTELGCPTIAAPSVSSSVASNVTCPYNLTGLVLPLPSGITAEWHTANNTLAGSLVADPTLVVDGTYYVFAKDSNGCYSTAVQVVVTCSSGGGSVTAPQNIQITPQFGSLLVQFQSAAFPPPANSYTLKRRLASDPDISGSYTTLGSTGTGISFNSSTSRWELSDAGAVANTLYVYRAISNGGASPYTDFTYANIICPTIGFTNSTTSITYSFTNSGGQIDKYVVELYDASGVNLLDSITELPGSPTFANPITNTFTGLTAGDYSVRTVVYIGTYSYACALNGVSIANNYKLGGGVNFSIDGVTGTGVPTLPPTGTSGTTQEGNHTGMSGSYLIQLTGSVVTTTKLRATVNGVSEDCVAVPGPGDYNLNITASSGDLVYIFIQAGTC